MKGRRTRHATPSLLKIPSEARSPLLGSLAFGLIDRGTNLVQIRPSSQCPLCCVFCSTDAGPRSRTRATEYEVDPDYLLSWFDEIAKFKGVNDLEAHIDTVGDPLAYPALVKLVKGLEQHPQVEVASIQTHGLLLTEDLIFQLEEAGLDRVNLSIDSMDPEKAKLLSNSPFYDLERVKDTAELVAKNTTMDLLIAPVWVPGMNGEDMPEIIEFALSVGAGKRWPPLGIQKYVPHRLGRRPREVKPMNWDQFYRELEQLENMYGVKLILSPRDFGTRPAPMVPNTMNAGEVVRARVVGPGWRVGEVLAIARSRSIMILNASGIPTGAEVRTKVIANEDNIYVGRLVS